MKVAAIALRLRPRSASEAADLGVRLVQGNARSVWATFTPLYAIVVLLAASTFEIAHWLPALIVFWLKPWLDRSLLFALSRAVFGEPTSFADVWRARPQVWRQQWFQSITTRRFSPWRSYTQPALQLEGQHGQSGKTRRRQLLRGKQGAALGMHLVFANFELLLVLSIVVFASLLAPADSRLSVSVWRALTEGDTLGSSIAFGLYAAVVLLLEPFYVGAGFAMYLNRRVELEAWDIEQEFRLAFAA